MKMRTVLTISGADSLTQMARDIERYPEQAFRAGRLAVNDVASLALTSAARDITQRYNLPASYVRERFTLREATSTNDVAVVAARKRGTRLARYDSAQLTAAAPRAKGDTRRGIAKGRKQSGVSFKEMRQGARETLRHAFLMPLRSGNLAGGNGMGIFERYGKRLKHLYGISPDQAFDDWMYDHRPNIAASLAKAYAARLQRELRRSK